jgi:hypothetical protein
VIMPNPLTDTADPGRYVSRAETEGVLAELEAALEEGVRIAVLSGPPGIGKTLLLHVLEERQRDARQLVFSPFLHFRPNEADEWLRGLLLESGLEGHTDWDWPEISSVAASREPLLLILDEAQSMPPATAARLAGGLRRVRAGMTTVLAGIEGPDLDRVVMALGEPVMRVRLEEPLTPAESRELVERAIPTQSDVSMHPSLSVQADARALHAAAEGNPRALQALMFRMELGEPPPKFPPDLRPDPIGNRALEVAQERDVADREDPTIMATPSPLVSPAARDRVGTLPSLGVRARARLGTVKTTLAIRSRPLAVASLHWLGDLNGWLAKKSRHAVRSGSAGTERLGFFARSALAAGGDAVRQAQRAVKPMARRGRAGLDRGVAAGAEGLRGLGSSARRLAVRGGQSVGARARRLRTPTRTVELLVATVSFAAGIVVATLVLRAPIEPAAPLPVWLASRAPVSAPPPEAPQPALSAREDARLPPAASSINRAGAETGERALPLVGAAPKPSGPIAPSSVAEPPKVTLFVNARPWASIRIDGEELGVTPLNRPDTRPGRYEVEATFPDGRTVRRTVEVGPDSHFVTFP